MSDDELVKMIQERLDEKNTDEERKELLDKITENWCTWCGGESPCYCMRDD